MKRAAIVLMFIALLVQACSLFEFVSGNGNGTTGQPEDTDLAGYFLPDPEAGLDGLQSFAQTLSITFSGTLGGKPLETRDSYQLVLNRATNTQFTISDITTPAGVRVRTAAGNAGEAYYYKSGDEECHVSWGTRAEGVEPFSPARLLPPLLGVKESGLEPLDGIAAKRHTFDAVSLGYPSATKVEGQVWLAEAGGYVLKYTMTIQDKGDLFGEGVEGKQVYEYTLSQINAVAGPDLPEGCLAVLTDFPSMPDASDIQRLPGVLAYTSASDAAQIQGFYEQQLPSTGWTMSSSRSQPDGGVTLVFLHKEDSKIALITLQKAESGTWVTVKVDPMGEALPGVVP